MQEATIEEASEQVDDVRTPASRGSDAASGNSPAASSAVPQAPCLALVSRHLLPRPMPPEPLTIRRYRVGEAIGSILLECTEELDGGEQWSRAEFNIARLYARPEGGLTLSAPLLGEQGERALLLPGTLLMSSHQGTRSLAEVTDVRRWCTEDVCFEDLGGVLRFTSGLCLRNAAVAAVTAATMTGVFDAFTFKAYDIEAV